jgi:VWFA-related protein
MKRACNLLFLLPIIVFTSLSAAAQAPEGPLAPRPDTTIQMPPVQAQAKLKVRVTLINTPVTVRNSKGDMVSSLEEIDFHITDNGVPQKIEHFDLGGEPLSLVILFQTSSRIAPMIPQIRKTGILFTQTVIAASGEAAILGFNDSIDKLQSFTNDGDQIERTVARLNTGTDGSKLYDAMAAGVEMLSSRPQATAENPGRRRVLFIVSEATDYGSSAKLGEVLRQAQLANITIYSVGLSTTRAELQAEPKNTHIDATPPWIYGMPGPPGTVQTPTSEQQRNTGLDLMALAVWAIEHAKDQVKDHALEVAATATGGAHLATYRDRSIEKAIDEIGGELHAQYNISYTPTDTNDTGYHEIKVNVDKKNLKVRARPGYFIAPPEN